MRSVYFMLLVTLSLQASAFYTTELDENEECVKWEYYTIGDFLAPDFVKLPFHKNADQNDIEMLDEFRPFESSKSDNIEEQKPNNVWSIAQFLLDLIESQSGRNRSKRFIISVPNPGEGIWKLVCVKRRLKDVVFRTLTAADFQKSASVPNDRVSRCIGRKEGENVAAGFCKRFYLRCSPNINVMMCSQLNEVFSEAKKTCIHKSELTECEMTRTIDSNAISLSQQSEKSAYDVIEDPQVFCQNRPDGFYQDNKNCSRVLQCFDSEFVEYPPCLKPLVFYPKREKCDYSLNVS